jgi:hypothetical protein
MRTLKILSVLAIAGIILLSFFSWFSCDDFCNKSELARYSVFKMAWIEYLNWDGRSLSISSFVQLTALKYFPVELTTGIWASAFVLTVIFIFKIIQIENPVFYKGKNSFVLVAVFCAMLWLGLWKLVPDIIYWSTGGSYSLLNLLGVLWLYIFLRGLKAERFNKSNCVFIFFVSIFLGMNSHNLIVSLLSICLVEAGYYKIVKKDNCAFVYILCASAGLLISGSVVFFAPGNFIRLSAGLHIGSDWNFLIHYLIVLARYGYWLFSLLVLCFAVLWLTGQNFRLSLKLIRDEARKKQPVFLFFHNHKYFVAAFATIAVFFVTSFFAVPRTAIFFSTFMVIYLFQKMWITELNIFSKRFMAGSMVFLSVFICILIFQMTKAYSVKQKLSEREKLFSTMKGNDVVVPSISKSSVPFAFSFVDVSPDSSYWVNRCVAMHYQLKTIRSDIK